MSRLKKIREARGSDAHELAKKLKIGSPWYFDLESDRSSWASEISISALRQLARELDVSPGVLLREDDVAVLGPEAFVSHITDHLIATNMSASEVSEKIGWDISRLIADPTQVGKLNIDGLRAICGELGLDWLQVLEEMKV